MAIVGACPAFEEFAASQRPNLMAPPDPGWGAASVGEGLPLWRTRRPFQGKKEPLTIPNDLMPNI
eukprot:458644-Karenia_brevis.AAC.1